MYIVYKKDGIELSFNRNLPKMNEGGWKFDEEKVAFKLFHTVFHVIIWSRIKIGFELTFNANELWACFAGKKPRDERNS